MTPVTRRSLFRGCCSILGLLLTVASLSANAADVAFYFDPAFVDQPQEATNLRTTLVNNGDTVTDLTGTTGAFTAALANNEILVIPELQNGDLNAALTPADRTEIADFVNGGGIVIVHGGTTPNDTNFINGVFGLSLSTDGTTSNGTSSLTAQAASGPFAGAPPSLDNLSAVTLVTTATIDAIPDSTVLYENDSDNTQATAFSVDVGAGKLLFFGWDWYDAPPQGSADGNWPALYGFVSTNTPALTGNAVSVPAGGPLWAGLMALALLLVGRGAFGRARRATDNPV